MLKNLSSLVTGGAQGMGKAFAEAILQHGAKVSILDIDASKGFEVEKNFKKTYGEDNVMFLKCDVTDSNSLREAFLRTYNMFNGFDLLVNSAGIATFKQEQWRKTLDVNLTALIESCYLGMEFMTKSTTNDDTFSHIINIASAGGLTGMAVDPVYSASKHGVVGLSRSLAERWAPLQIRVNCLCPTFTETDLFKRVGEMNHEYEELMKSMPLMNCSDVVKVFEELLKETTTGEVYHISLKGTKRINKKISRL